MHGLVRQLTRTQHQAVIKLRDDADPWKLYQYQPVRILFYEDK